MSTLATNPDLLSISLHVRQQVAVVVVVVVVVVVAAIHRVTTTMLGFYGITIGRIPLGAQCKLLACR